VLKQAGGLTLILSLTLAFFMLSSSVVSFITISNGEAKASSDEGGGGGGDGGGDGSGGDGGGEQQNDGSSEDGGEKQQEDVPQEETTQDEVVTDEPLEDMMMGAMPPAPATAPPAVVEECPKGQMKVDENCVKIAPDPTCQPGQMMVQGNCVQIANPNSKCPQGQLYVDGKCVPIPSQKQQQPLLCPTASTSSLVDSGRLVFVADTTGTPQGPTGGSSSKPADPTSSNCPTGTNQPPTTPQSLTSPTTPSSPTTTPSQSAATPPPSDGTTPTTPLPQGTTTQPAPPSSGNQPSSTAGNSGGEGSQVQKKYEPPAGALPYRGNEVELIGIYANPDPTNPAIVRTDKVGEDVHTTFADGTIKTSKPSISTSLVEEEAGDGEEEASPSDFYENDIRITPGAGTALDKLGVIQIKLDYSTTSGLGDSPLTIKYGDGKSIDRKIRRPMEDPQLTGTYTIHKDSKGNVLETTMVDPWTKTTYSIKPDGSTSDYKADGSYITTWPKKADGSQQFYDSKQGKVFVRDADGNIIPPKE
jgi:hypothetical protein